MIVLVFLFVVLTIFLTIWCYRLYAELTLEKEDSKNRIDYHNKFVISSNKEKDQFIDDIHLLESELLIKNETIESIKEVEETQKSLIETYEAEHKLLNQEIVKVYEERNKYRDSLMNSTTTTNYDGFGWSDNYEAEYLRNMGLSPEEIKEEPL